MLIDVQKNLIAFSVANAQGRQSYLVYAYDAEKGFIRRGELKPAYQGYPAWIRGLYIGDFLYLVTPDGLIYDGQAEELLVRTTNGDVGILARHMNYVAPLGMGRAVIVSDGQRRTAACIGGMVSVSKGEVTLVPTTFEWADKIDVARAEAALEKAEKVLHDQNASDTDLRLAEAKLHRALVRKSVASNL